MTKTAQVKTKYSQYNIEIGTSILSNGEKYIKPFCELDYVVVITDDNVEKLHLKTLTNSLAKASITARIHCVKSGEQAKSFETYQKLCNNILAEGIERKTLIIALGGGVIGDLAGFIASSLLRGLNFIQIPTTLLAQVDSSVGGKTGINSNVGKNLIGAFHQPLLVLCDVGVLKTLPKRQMLAGYAEVIKYGLILDEEFFKWLEKNGENILNLNEETLIQAVYTSCSIKAEIVRQDEKEANVRMLLNLGHTFGHALEAKVGFNGKLLHGEAISLGMIIAYRTSLKLGIINRETLEKVIKHFKSINMPTEFSDIDFQFCNKELMELMTKDKKVVSGEISYIIPYGIGKAKVVSSIENQLIKSILDEMNN